VNFYVVLEKIDCMKKLFTLLPIFVIIGFVNVHAQIFWVENFESGSSTGLVASSYTGPNGTWAITTTGAEDANNNQWYVSCAENGHTTGICGTGCAPVTLTATRATLHIGANPSSFGDIGASYDAGGGLPYNTTTDRRAESPKINCTGKSGITISFYYIENGDGTNDDATLWYYDGAAWGLLDNPVKTPITCAPQGTWTHYTYSLPPTANGNPNVKIGFRWVNNNDGVGTDPSFAVDSVSLAVVTTATVTPVASFTTSPTPASACTDSCVTFTSTSTVSAGTIDSVQWVAVVLGFTVRLSNANPFSFCAISPYNAPGTYSMRLRVFGNGKVDSISGTVTVKAAPKPVITKTGKTLSVAGAYASFQWSNSSGIIPGATAASYTYTVSGSYSVMVDSGGCPGTSNTFSTAQVAMVNAAGNAFWVAQSGSPAITVHATEPLEEPLAINIFDVAGRKMIGDNWSKGSDMKQIDGSLLTPGLYIIRISNNTTSSVLRWMK
jgi:hypothetical protein